MANHESQSSPRPRRPRVTKAVRSRLGRLLEMAYRPSELAEELGVCVDTVRRGWLRAGAPHERDEDGAVWLVGTEVAAWLEAMGDRPKVVLEPGEAYCLRGQAGVAMVEGEREAVGPAVLVRGRCTRCGGRVARFERAGESQRADHESQSADHDPGVAPGKEGTRNATESIHDVAR